MSELSKLASLILLADTDKRIDIVNIQFGVYGPYGPGGHDTYVSDWIAYVRLPPESGLPPHCFGEFSGSLEGACESLLAALRDKGFQPREVPVQEMIPRSEEVEVFIARFRSLILDLDKLWSVCIGYWPRLDSEKWDASIDTSKWGRGIIARKEGQSLYQACAALWEMLQEMRDELPKMV